MSAIPEDLTCRECGEVNLDEEACFNQKDTCTECCGRLYPDACCGEDDGTIPDEPLIITDLHAESGDAERIAELRAEWADATGDNPDDYALSEDDWSLGLGDDGAAEIVALLERQA